MVHLLVDWSPQAAVTDHYMRPAFVVVFALSYTFTFRINRPFDITDPCIVTVSGALGAIRELLQPWPGLYGPGTCSVRTAL